jgi:bacillolysin
VRNRRLMITAALGTVLMLTGAVVAVTTGSGRPEVAGVSATPFVTPENAPGSTAGSAQVADVVAAAKAAGQVKPLSPAAAVNELRHAANTPPTMHIDAQGQVRGVFAPAGQALNAVPGAPLTKDPGTAAAAFVNRYGQGFGLRPGQQVRATRVSALPGGDHTVRFQQQVGGVPVLGGNIIVAVNASGRVVTATGEAPAAAPTSIHASLPANEIVPQALAAAALRTGAKVDDLAVTGNSLWLYDPRVLNAPGRPELRPTWKVTVGWKGAPGRVATVLVDATDGSVSLAINEREEVKDRTVCDNANAQVDLNNPDAYDCSDRAGGPPIIRREGQAPAGVSDVNNAYDFLGATYDFYMNNFGRDSIDGIGLPMRATVRVCGLSIQTSCPYANAFWDGAQMVFGAGFAAADDVVGHELTHGVTQYTSELFYFSEAGGINEALSDIFGEFIDQGRGSDDDSQWLLGEDLPGGAIRSMSSPHDGNQPDRALDPSFWSAAYNSTGDNGGVHTLSGVANKAAYLIAAGNEVFNGQTFTGGIGIPKSAQIWYRVEHMLPSGAQYDDLASILPAACRSILGVTGITQNDCRVVDKAVLATNMDWTNPDEADLCPSAGQPVKLIFQDSFDRGTTKWNLDPAWWMNIPSAALPVSWSNSGRSSLYAFTDLTLGSPVGHYAQMRNGVDIPASGTTFLWMATNILSNNSGGSVLVDTGSGFNTTITPTAGHTGTTFTRGYDSQRFTLNSFGLAGQTVKLAFQPGFVNGGEWLIDDVMIYQCVNVVGQPQHVAALLTNGNTEADVSWDAPVFSGPGIGGYEVFVQPTPDSLALPVVLPSGTTSLHLTGLDPAKRYSVTVRAVGSDAVGGQGVTVEMPTDLLVACNQAANRQRGSNPCAGLPVPGQVPR